MSSEKGLKVYYATAADVELLGAPRSIDIPIVKYLNELGCEVSWFGINIDNCNDACKDITSLRYSKFYKFFIRLKNKILRELNIQASEAQKINAQKKFDEWLSALLIERKHDIDENLIFIGRAVSSELSFKTIKKYGGKCVLHSQWMHPETQKRILKQAFNDLNLDYPQILSERVRVQLREIELCDKIWCISNLVYDSYLQNGVPKEKLLLCPLGVDTNVFKPASTSPKQNSDKYNIVFVGNINIEKGVHVLLNALALGEISNCQLILNGAVADYFESFLQGLSNKLKKLNVEVVVESGFPLKNLQKADLFILPSLHESFGLVVLEAMACGLPVIVTDQVGASDHIIPGENGFIVPANSVEKLSEKILYFYNDRNQRDSFGKKSFTLSQDLSWPRVTERFIESVIRI